MKAIYGKLLLIQNELGAIKKEATNPFFNSRYFDINALIEHIKPYLEKHKLVLLQPLSSVGPSSAIKTVLFDTESGESIEDTVPLTHNDDPQKMGSAITYFRRYAIQSLFLLEAEDDDGNAAKPAARPQNRAVAAPVAAQGGEWEYKTGISKKNGKPWWGKQRPGSKEMVWLTELEYAQQANGGRLETIKPAEAQAMRNEPDFVDEDYGAQY